MRSTRLLAIAVVIAFLPGFGRESRGHDLPHAFQFYPPAPPTLDPGPDAALLKIRIVDAKTHEPVSATVAVNDGNYEPDKDPLHAFSLRKSGNRFLGAIRLRKVPYYFFAEGSCEVRVPAGPVVVEVRKGYEYQPAELTLITTARQTQTVEVALERTIDMAAMGWYSGDVHVHIERTGENDDTILSLTSAKDLRYTFLLSYNTVGYDPKGVGYESTRQMRGLGDQSDAHRGVYYISSGQEYRPVKLGHVTVILADSYVPGTGKLAANIAEAPSLATIADQAHALHGVIGLNHGGYFNHEGDRLLLDRKMDYLELLQFGEYRFLGLSGWYDFLNIGYRLPMVGASDYPFTRELGSEITYVWSDATPTPRQFAEGLAAGRSFATSGPLLFMTVGGEKPGAIIRPAGAGKVMLPVDVRVHSAQYPVRTLELIVNGEVVERRFAPEGKSEWSLRHLLSVPASCWIAARVSGEPGTEAHTNPVYVYREGKVPFNAVSARQIITRLEGSMATITNREIVGRMETLKHGLEEMIRNGRSALPAP